MNLFDIVGGKIVIHPDGLAIPCFKHIWERNKDKDHVTDVISYIVFKNKWDSPYVLSISPDDLESKLKERVFGNKDYELTEDEKICEEEYISFNDTLIMLLLSGIRLKLWDQSEYYKLTKGEPLDLQSIEKFNKGVKELKGTLETLDTLEKSVKAGELNNKKIKGDKKVNAYELPN